MYTSIDHCDHRQEVKMNNQITTEDVKDIQQLLMPETRIIGMGTINLILQVEAGLLAVRSLNNITAKRRHTMANIRSCKCFKLVGEM